MKKILISCLAFTAATGAWAQSTCETRVDAHQKATTNQRVNYCLVPGYGEENNQGPQLIFSSTETYTVAQPAQQGAVRPKAEQGRFDDANVEVTHSFVQTRQFPKWGDDRVSEQYKIEYQEAMTSGPQTAQEAISHTECEPEEDVIWEEPQGADETKAGVKARQSKPGRRLLAPVNEETSVTSGLESVEEVAGLADQYTYDNSSYAPAAIPAQPAAQTDGYAPASIADMPSESSDEISAGAYSYAPASYGSTTTKKETTTETKTVTQPAKAEEPEDIPVGEYSYAPASYGSTTTKKETTTVTETVTQPAKAEEPEDIPVGEYSYAPATYGKSSAIDEVFITNAPAAPSEPVQSESEDIPVGEYSYAPAK